jgi:hypothetical protein
MWGKSRVALAQAAAPPVTEPCPVQCPLCGNRFDANQAEACSSCPALLRGCGMVACPRCGHEFPLSRPRLPVFQLDGYPGAV